MESHKNKDSTSLMLVMMMMMMIIISVVIMMVLTLVQFQSHQIFHVFVVAAAFIHYYGMAEIANNRLTFGHCFEDA